MDRNFEGKPVADAVKSRRGGQSSEIEKEKRILPLLMILRAGEREDDIAYEKRVIKNCGKFTSM